MKMPATCSRPTTLFEFVVEKEVHRRLEIIKLILSERSLYDESASFLQAFSAFDALDSLSTDLPMDPVDIQDMVEGSVQKEMKISSGLSSGLATGKPLGAEGFPCQ